ncbi:uncharacterized protein LOC127279097 isoform X2 [Leptopilina boulardi]|uniref:uncharacterized protein LOC127279097 isoform X2 n=1 Tax=Leptopilina boulardi TaxID=63433 RepID=UPI0021F51136|nr:uncharacterized protein LOC127279097 isoform X2 [Leptopilina boulardi]
MNTSSNNEERKKEWPYFKGNKNTIDQKVPLLIMEIHRLRPFFSIDKPRLHVLNMPELQIRNVEIIGIITKAYERIDDGTGQISVVFKLMNELKEERKKIDSKFQRLSKVAELKNLEPDQYQLEIQNLEKRWMQETNNGKLGIFQVLDYVNVKGFIDLDFGKNKVTKNDLSLDKGNLCKPVIYAKTIQHITEKEYNDKMQSFISGLVRNRYHEN